MNQPRICRTESWMTCKGQFFCRCKKPHAVISSRVCRSQKECSFRKVCPSCKLLHLTIFETITINYHCYGIAPIRLAGENIYLGESALHVDNSVTLSSMNNGGEAGNRKQSGQQPCPPQPTNPLPNKKMNHINFKQIYSNLATKPAQVTKFLPKALRTLSSDLGLWAL